MIARCFQKVNYPILPTLHSDKHDQVSLRERHYRLFTPSDFDYSPYFEIIKYPAWNFSDQPAYRTLPWQHNDAATQPVQEEVITPLDTPATKPKLQTTQPEQLPT